MKLFDVFISHASEDKEEFVRALAQRLENEHLCVWYDEFSLKLGDSLRRSIDLGLSRSRYGIVVLSPSFFEKQWPQRELDGLVARETLGGERVILPVWHRITKAQVCEYSPTIADLVAVQSDKGVDQVVEEILKVIRPSGSPLIIARDRLIEFGLTSPVVTDEWWLDIVEASNREYPWGFVPHSKPWGRWTFPLPKADNPYERGERLAWTAMQLKWEHAAQELRISQITPPAQALEFVESQPGLADIASKYPAFLATYTPQLTIRGLSGEFESAFDNLLARSMAQYEICRQSSSSQGSGLTTTACPPKCDQVIALRHPTFGDYEPSYIACSFVQGEIAGPPCRVYETYDYIIWLLSEHSHWLPPTIRDLLVLGMKGWIVWLWFDLSAEYKHEFGVQPYEGIGHLATSLCDCDGFSKFILGSKAEQDLLRRTEISRQLLGLNEPAHVLADRFLRSGFISEYFQYRERHGGKHDEKRSAR